MAAKGAASRHYTYLSSGLGALLMETMSHALSSTLADIWDDGCACEEHLARYREEQRRSGDS